MQANDFFKGHMTKVTMHNGEQYTGVFSGAKLESSDMRYLLKMVKRVTPTSDKLSNGNIQAVDDYIGIGEDHAMMFDTSDVVDLVAADVVIGRAHQASEKCQFFFLMTCFFSVYTDFSNSIYLFPY